MKPDGQGQGTGGAAGAGEDEADGKKGEELGAEAAGFKIAAEDGSGHGQTGGGIDPGRGKLLILRINHPVSGGGFGAVLGEMPCPVVAAEDLQGGFALSGLEGDDIRGLDKVQNGKESAD